MNDPKFSWRNFLRDRKNVIYLAIVAVLSCILLFARLDEKLISNCDEVVTTYFVGHIIKTGDVLSTVNYSNQNYGTTRPPLFLWVEWLAVNIGGYNEFSFRAVSAICGLCTILMVYFFVGAKTNNPFSAFCCAIVLMTSQGFINHHVTRTADYDAMLTMFMTAYLLTFYNYLSTSRISYLAAFTIFITLAYLTKSVAALLFLPSLLGLYIYEKGISLRSILTILASLMTFVCLIVPFYFVKEAHAPGFFRYAFTNELIGKYFSVEGKNDNHWASLKELFIAGRFQPWILVLPVSIFFLFQKNTARQKLVNFFLINAVAFLIIISFSDTQFSWYLAPFYPVASIAVGLTIADVIGANRTLRRLTYGIFVVFLFGMAYKLFIRKTEDIPSDVKNELRNPKTGQIVYIRPTVSLTELFYLQMQESKGNRVRFGTISSCKPGDILFCDSSTIKALPDSLVPRIEKIGEWNKHVFVRWK